jgi:gluconate 5-dehydrogenase
MKRGGEFEDLNGLMVLFASDGCAFITGHALAVDGGSLRAEALTTKRREET